jgi:hypothetical protein
MPLATAAVAGEARELWIELDRAVLPNAVLQVRNNAAARYEAVAGGRDDRKMIDGSAGKGGARPCDSDSNREEIVRQRTAVDVDRDALHCQPTLPLLHRERIAVDGSSASKLKESTPISGEPGEANW